MKPFFITIIVLSFTHPVLAQDTTRILFGSCLKQEQPVPIFKTIIDQKPDAFIFLGDNIYADTTDMEIMRAKYAKLQSIPGFIELQKTCPLYATWDDHDYGVNDGGAEYPMRVEAQTAFLDFWQEPENTARRNTPGIYDSVIFGEEPKRIQLILLDTRYFRGPLKKGERRTGGIYYPLPEDSEVTMLGDDQWKWLEHQLSIPAEIRIIASSIQFISEAAGQETWANLPGERNRLIKLIAKTGANGVFFISGDRHWADISAQKTNVPYPLYDFTSSGMNQTHKRGTPTQNQYRITPKTWHKANFGQIDIDWLTGKITVKIRDVDATTQLEETIILSELSPD